MKRWRQIRNFLVWFGAVVAIYMLTIVVLFGVVVKVMEMLIQT